MVTLTAKNIEVIISDTGSYHSVSVCGKEILSSANGRANVLTVCTGGTLLRPEKMEQGIDTNILNFLFPDGNTISLCAQSGKSAITLEVTEVPAEYDAVIFGEFEVTPCDVVGEVIGVVQNVNDNIAFGLQALNIKTLAGVPQEYYPLMEYYKNGESSPMWHSEDNERAAAISKGGSTIHFHCRRRNSFEHRMVNNVPDCLVSPVEGHDADIVGAKIALFGCLREEAIHRIGEIELEYELPHPMFDGEWGKTSRAAMKSYLISNFGANDWDYVLEKVKLAGWEYMYHEGPFGDWGHFNFEHNAFPGGDDQWKELTARAAAQGISTGVHTLTNFTTTNDAYVTPIPNKHLLKQCELHLMTDIDENTTEFDVERSDFFTYPLSLNALQVGDELIQYSAAEEKDGIHHLTGCTRGAFGTASASHFTNEICYRLWDYPYNTLFPDLILQDEYCDRIVELFNDTKTNQISFDGLEGCSYTGQDQYAVNRFVSRCYEGWDHNVLNDASNLNHYNWHICTRMNWGEPWGEAMRAGQLELRIKNQDYFRRNLFPRMLGWFLIRLAERKFECSTLEDLEWALSESAGFDAGYGMTIGVKTMRRHGQINKLLEAIKNWEMLRLANVFTEEQKEQLRDPATEWHLQKEDDSTFTLYPITISKHYICDLGEMQPGQAGGSDWNWSNPYEEGEYALRLKVEGDGEISSPTIITPKGRITFDCTVEADQYLLFHTDFNGSAEITDKNYKHISDVTYVGNAILPSGNCAIAFACQHSREDTPEVSIRYITRGCGEKIRL